MTPLIPIRPLQKSDESPLGYLARIAYLNHFSSLTQCVKSYRNQEFTISFTKDSMNESASFLSDITGKKIAFDETNIVGQYTNKAINAKSKKANILRKPSICPKCIEQDGYLKSQWQYALNSYCENHQCEHINVCPTCKRELQWNVALLKLRCQRCDGKLYSDTLKSTPLHVQKLKTLKDEEYTEYANDLVKTAYRLMRPFDLMVKKITTSPVMRENWNKLLHSAALHIEADIEVPSAYDFLSGLSSDGYIDYIQSPLEREAISSIRRKLSREEAHSFMNLDSIKKWFGLNDYHVNTLMDMGVINVVFQKKYCSSFIYDYRDWKLLFDNVIPLDGNGDDIENVANEAPVFWCHPEELLIGVLLAKIPVKFANPQKPNFRGASVDRQAAHKYFRERRSFDSEAIISRKNAILCLGNNSEFYSQLSKSSEIERMRVRPRCWVVTSNSLDAVLKKYDVPERHKILNAYS